MDEADSHPLSLSSQTTRLSSQNSLHLIKKINIPFINTLQTGPTCGLHLVCQLSGISVPLLFEQTRKKGYSNHGECFSVYFLEDIAKWAGLNPEVIRSADALNYLDKGVVLIAYDMDRDKGPCINNGRYIHWMVIHGVYYFESSEDQNNQKSEIYVVCSHGKSRYPSLYEWELVLKSNLGLDKVSIELDCDKYIVPNNSLQLLQGRCLFIPKSH